MGERLKAFPGARHLRVDRAVKDQVPFVERVFGSDKRNGAGSVRFEKFGNAGCLGRHWNDFRGIWARYTFCAHSGILVIRAIGKLVVFNIEKL